MVERGGFYVMLLTKTKINLEAYFQNCLRYDVTCLAARLSSAGGVQGDVGLVKKNMPLRWGVESTLYHGPNMVSCDIITGLTRTPLIGEYIPLLTMEHLLDLEEALQRFRYPVVLGELNVDLNKMSSLRIQQVAYLLAEYGLVDQFRHFRQRRRFRNLKTWSQVRQGTFL